MKPDRPPQPRSTSSSTTSIDQFLQQVERHPATRTTDGGHLLFAMDATASRQPTWDTACQLQTEMFQQTRELGRLQVKLCFYRGYDELRSSPWHQGADNLVRAMQAVQCLGGHTQIGRLLDHALQLHQQQPIQALVFIGDCIEEPLDTLCQRAGRCGLQKLPLFLFQEGHDPVASNGFTQLARLSGGAHCRFDLNSPERLSQLLGAVAVYATGGNQALKRLKQQSAVSLELTRQLEHHRP